ncbi:MAG: sigma-54 dependent transcriptional regulator [Bryobacteraceae bacterium]
MIRALLYSDQSALQQILGATLASNIHLQVDSDKQGVLDRIAQKQVDVLIVDLNAGFVPLEIQLAFIAQLQTTDLPVLVLTDDDRRSTALELMQHGVYDHFRNPPSPLEMTIIIRRAYEHAQLKRELAEAKQTIQAVTRVDQLTGRSQKMLSVYDLIHRVADLDTGVLITGESGTGKELVARAIHNLGGRSATPFVAVSCGAIPETLIEAELFGHEKGAFTGATGARQGLLEMAGEGTLFLDEIGELSLSTQVKLLRVLQQREFTRLGGQRPIPLKARVLYATHRDLNRMIEEETFRRDLYFRINVINIQVPALRQRPEDIPALTESFLKLYSASCRKTVTGVHPHAMAALINYEWPGNVRELENVIHRAIIVGQAETIGIDDLPEQFHDGGAGSGPIPASSTFEHLLRDYKRKIAQQAIQDCNGNKTLAAVSLQISRAYLHRLLRSDVDECEVA